MHFICAVEPSWARRVGIVHSERSTLSHSSAHLRGGGDGGRRAGVAPVRVRALAQADTGAPVPAWACTRASSGHQHGRGSARAVRAGTLDPSAHQRGRCSVARSKGDGAAAAAAATAGGESAPIGCNSSHASTASETNVHFMYASTPGANSSHAARLTNEYGSAIT